MYKVNMLIICNTSTLVMIIVLTLFYIENQTIVNLCMCSVRCPWKGAQQSHRCLARDGASGSHRRLRGRVRGGHRGDAVETGRLEELEPSVIPLPTFSARPQKDRDYFGLPGIFACLSSAYVYLGSCVHFAKAFLCV